MPIPRPGEGERRGDFIERCMGDDTMVREYPNQEKRAAVCFSSWKATAHAKEHHSKPRGLSVGDKPRK